MFDLAPQAKTDSYEPSFRSLFSYFARRGRDAFSIPFEHSANKQTGTSRLTLRFCSGFLGSTRRSSKN